MNALYLGIALFFLILLVVVIIGIVYFYRHLKLGNGTSCQSNYQCLGNQTCINSTCQSQTCSRNTDCQTNQQCVYGVCITQNCDGADTCTGGSGQVCISSSTGDFCAFLPPSCNTDQDCYAGTLGCSNGKCIQCQANRDCPPGQSCNGQGVCVGNCVGSPCASGNLCTDGACCPGTSLISCTNTSQCNSDTPYCIDGTCTCIPGSPLSKCTTTSDCVSGSQCISDTQGNQVCSYQGGTSCLYNNQGGSTTFPYCPVDTPFCVNGTCSIASIGSACGGATGSTGAICGGFCVNGVCSSTAGWFGDQCVITSDCSYVTGTSTEQQSFQCVGTTCM